MTDEIPRTAYEEVADKLRAQIESGTLRVGDAIPSTAQICKDYGVSTTVARRAVSELRSAGLLIGRAGKGVYVKATPKEVESRKVDLDGLAQQVGELRATVEEIQAARDERVDAELGRLRRQVGLIHTQLMDLYARLGQSYPHESLAEFENETPPDRESTNRRTGT
ncbi:hypothetical protein GCM10009678_05090 [Actinomadura kijaniata]|uniref:DNA-binding GntR family transcriptional regulator n=1 Tax=Actinomadura namibiensis TaxID=182080 RepID=A0A7W3LTI5_ACTNM|nr:GntR family transcriptional regulator [Actinomadura namibiensis]MBA8953927.1 DNA-binding GntR family transcriptional regulator [Actinomadura namibiensis]